MESLLVPAVCTVVGAVVGWVLAKKNVVLLANCDPLVPIVTRGFFILPNKTGLYIICKYWPIAQ